MRGWTYILLAVATVAWVLGVGRASAQCVDWSPNFRDPGGNGTDGTVTDMVLVPRAGGDRLYICGSFTRVGGVAARGVAVFDGTSWAPVGNWTMSGTPNAIEWFDDGTGGTIYVAGGFNDAPTLSIRNFAKLVGTSWVGVGGDLGGQVRDMIAYNDGNGPALWIAGNLGTVGLDAQRTEFIVSWNGTSWRTFSAGPIGTLNLGYDPVRQRAVLFSGGNNPGSGLGDTWTWDGLVWTKSTATGPATRQGAQFAFDSVRSRLLMLGGGTGSNNPPEAPTTLWAWDGSAWSVAAIAPMALQPALGFAMAYDAARDRLVLFGGSLGAGFQTNETWEFDGTAWARRMPPVSPPGRVEHRMAYDAVRQRVVMYGGTSSSQQIPNDTWEWDGTTWSSIATPALGSLVGHSMVFDSARGRVLVTGGSRNGGTPATDVWEWSGSAWAQIAPLDSTQNLPDGPVVFDSARNVLLLRSHSQGFAARTALRPSTGPLWTTVRQGGFNNEVVQLLTHDDGNGTRLYARGSFGLAQGMPAGRMARWDGQLWSAFSSNSFGSADQLVSVPSGPAAGLWLSGSDGLAGANLFRWNGSAWMRTLAPTEGFYFASDFGAGMRLACVGLYHFDGFNAINGTISTFDGTAWSPLDFEEPGARTSAAMAHDPVRRRTVMFGGTTNGGASGAIAQTLEFDGRHWNASGASGPSARYGHAMAFDPVRNLVLCVGGQTASGANTGETWGYDGTAWTLLAPSVGGTTRFRSAIAWDSNRQRLVLFGGQSNSGVVGDLLEWDGSTWTAIASSGPLARWKHAMAYDPTRRAVVLAGGADAADSQMTDAWTWNGAAWTRLTDGIGLIGGSLHFDDSIGMVTANFSSALFPNGRFQSLSRSGVPNTRFTAWAYDSSLKLHVLFGGTSTNTNGPTALRGSLVSFGNQLVSAPYRVFNASRMVNFDSGNGTRQLFMGRGERPSASNLCQFGDACTAPVILTQPQNVIAVFGQSVTMTVDAIGSAPLSFQWRRNGVPLVEITNVRTGTTTAQLSFGTAWSYSDAGTYDCVVTNPLGQIVSNGAELTVEGIGPSGPVTLSKVAIPGDPVPGRAGYAFDGYGNPLLSSTGEVVVNATFTNGADPRSGIMRWTSGVTSLVSATGDTLPQTELSSTSVTPSARAAVADGGVVFRSDLRGGTITGPEYRNGLWYKSASDGALIARHGLEAPGTDAVFAYYSTFFPLANAVGDLLLSNLIFGGGAMPGNDSGIWSWGRGGELSLVARTGSPAPGLTGTFSSLTATGISSDSSVYFSGVVNGVRGVWGGLPTNPSLLVLGSQPAPGYAAGVTLNDVFAYAPTTEGRAMVIADVSLSGNQSALYRLSPGSLSLIAKSGDPIPGRLPTDVYGTMTPYASTTDGRMLFMSNVLCPSCGGRGFFIAQPNNAILPIAYATMPRPPGVPSIFTTVSIGSDAAMNELGQVVLSGSVSAGSVSGSAVFGWTAASGVFAIATPGMQFQVLPGVYRTCSNAWITGPDPESSLSGRSLSLNDRGQVVLRLRFTDNTTGVWIGQFGDFLAGSFPCPTIFSSPSNQTAYAGQTRTFTVTAAGSPPVSFVWSLNGSALSDGGRVTGSRTPTLVLRGLTLADAGLLRCVVSNPCSQSASTSFALTVRCPADFDDGTGTGTPDGGVSIDDLLYYIERFTEGVAAADLDDGSETGTPDGGVTIEDLLYFLGRFEAGC